MSEVDELFRAAALVVASETRRLRDERPKAHAWIEVWAELRQVFGPFGRDGMSHQTALVLLTHNKRTRRTHERVLLVGTGESPAQTARDLLEQIRHIEKTGEPLPTTRRVAPVCLFGAYPVGMLGKHVVGQA